MVAESDNPLPDGWADATPYYERAVASTREALASSEVVGNVATYYRPDGNFAGGTFIGVGEVDPYRITPSDLLALTLLDVSAPPAAVRRLLEGPRAEGIAAQLSEEALPSKADLRDADTSMLKRMADLYVDVRRAVSVEDTEDANPWVTASKLCARKRPDLFPVRDNVVCTYLGLIRRRGNYEVDYQVYRHLLNDDEIRVRLDEVVSQASEEEGVDVGGHERRLRHLDVVLWMHARGMAKR